MLPLLLGLALAQDAPDLEARLLGPEPTVAVEAPVEAAPPAPSLEMPPWWTLPLLGLGLAFAWNQRRRTEQVEADAMRVLGRTALGKDASVVLLEVRDAYGAWRRLLVGSGTNGPQLITGLGSGNQVVATPAPAPAPVPAAAAARAGHTFASMMDDLDTLPEIPAYPVDDPEPHPTMVTSWNRAEEAPPAPRPALGRAGALAAAIHRRPPVSTDPPPVRPEPGADPTRRSVEDGLELLAEIRQARGRVGTNIQTYG